jgi:hypothetical protein
MKAARGQANLACSGGASEKRVEAIATELRADGMLPKGGRGPHAPDATAEELGLLMLAVAAATRIADAAETAQSLAATTNEIGETLINVIGSAIANPIEARAIRHIRLMPTYPMAEVTYRSDDHPDRCVRFFDAATWQVSGMVPGAQGQAYVGPIGHIGGAALAQMAIDFSLNPDGKGEAIQ